MNIDEAKSAEIVAKKPITYVSFSNCHPNRPSVAPARWCESISNDFYNYFIRNWSGQKIPCWTSWGYKCLKIMRFKIHILYPPKSATSSPDVSIGNAFPLWHIRHLPYSLKTLWWRKISDELWKNINNLLYVIQVAELWTYAASRVLPRLESWIQKQNRRQKNKSRKMFNHPAVALDVDAVTSIIG